MQQQRKSSSPVSLSVFLLLLLTLTQKVCSRPMELQGSGPEPHLRSSSDQSPGPEPHLRASSGPNPGPVPIPGGRGHRVARMTPLWRIMNSKPLGAFCQNSYECSTGICRVGYCSNSQRSPSDAVKS